MTRINPLSQFYYQTLILQRNINQNQNVLDRTLERLSTGLRINRAADDPFGITQAKRIQTQQISNQQASDNILQAFSLAATAENGAKSIQNNLTRMRELILQSLNDTSTGNDRARIQTEIDKLIADTDRIARSEIFNNRKLLDGSLGQFKLAQPASSALSINQSLTDSAGNTLSFLSGTPTVSDQVSDYDRVQFQLFDNGSGGYGLNISTASGGVVLSYNDVLSAPTSLNVPVGGSTVSFERAAYAPAPTSGFGPLSSSEFADSLDQLVSAGRLDPVSNGSLSLQLGSQTFANFYSVTGSSSLQELLTTINGLTSGLSASYDTNTGKIAVTYNNQSTETSSQLTSYASAGTTTGVGGPYASFALLPSAPNGPAYRDPSGFLPASGFNLTAPPSDFPTLPGSLNTAVSFAGSDSSILSVLGLADTSNNGSVDYTAAFYGQALSTGNPGEYVNRTLVSIETVTASQSLSGSTIGLSPSELDTTFRVLNTALVSSSAFAPGDLTIDFGSAGIFSYQTATGALFDPETNSIQDLLTAINDFNPSVVSASFNPTTAELTLSNTPLPSTTEAKVTDPGLSNGSFSIDFGSNGVFNYTLDLNSSTIPDFLSALNSFNGNVSASFNATSDTFTLNNQVSPTYATKLTDPGLTVGGTLTADYGSNGSKSITLTNTTTIQDVITALGTSGVTVSYDESADTLNFTNTASGPTSTSDTKVSNPPLQAGTFSIDFGDGRIYSYAFDPNTTTIQSFQDNLNSWGASNGVTAGYDSNTDQFTISNSPSPLTTTINVGYKLSENGIGNSALQINFGDNGTFTSDQPLQDYTLQGIVNEINNWSASNVGARVSASFDENTDQLTLSNTVSDTPGTGGSPKVTATPFDPAGDLTFHLTGYGISSSQDLVIVSSFAGDLNNATIEDIVNWLNIGSMPATGMFNYLIADFSGDKLSLNGYYANPDGNTFTVEAKFTGSNANAFRDFFKINDYYSGPGINSIHIESYQAIDNGVEGEPTDITAADVSSKTLGQLMSETYGGTPALSGNNSITFESAGANAFFNIGNATDNNSDANSSGDDNQSLTGGNIDNAGNALLDIDSNDKNNVSINNLINNLIQTTTTTNGSNQISINDGGTGLAAFFKLSSVGNTGTGAVQSSVSSGDIDKSTSTGYSVLDIDSNDFTSTSLASLVSTPIVTSSTPAGNNAITFTDSSGLASLFKLSDVASNVGGGSGTYTQSTGSSAAIDNGPQGQPLDVNGTDVTGTSLLSLSQTPLLSSGGNDNSITFSAGLGEKIRTFFDLSDRASNASSSLSGTYSQSTTSPAAIDNGTTGSPYDITAADITSGTALTFQELITPFASGSATNTITFGGALGPVLADFFNLNPINPSTGSGPQSIVSSSGIDNRSVDPSLTLQAADLTRSLASLYTPKLGLISGPLVIDGNTVLTIDPDQDTLNDVLTAINAYSGNSNQTYIASFNPTSPNSGALEIEVIDQESLTAPGSAAALDPNGATPQINGNQITLDTASYLVGGAPPDAYPIFSTTAPPAPYQFTAPTAATLSSAISFSGSSNLFSLLGLSNVSTGSPTPSGSAEYRGTFTQTDAVNYVLNGEQRQTFTATSTAISQRIGNDTVGAPLSGIPNDGIVAEVAIAPTILSQSGQGLTFQVGPNQGNTFSLSINGLTADLLNLEGLKLYRAGDSDTLARLRANNALQVVDQALEQTLSTLGQIGVGMGILDLQLRQSEERNQIFSQTLSDLQDANVEEEIANLTKAQINIQVGAALQAQNAADTQRIYDLLFNSQQNINPLFNSFLNR